MKVIVTGATGGLGRNVVTALLERGDDVVAFGRNTAVGDTLQTRFVACELSDHDAVLDAFETADAVVHCAAMSSDWGAYDDFHRSNVDGTANVLAAMVKHEIPKIVHVSTPSIYFDYHDRRNVHEHFRPCQFVNAYAHTKHEAEQLILHSDRDSVIIRPRGIFGEYDQVVVPEILRIAENGALPLVKRAGRPAGSALTDVTYVGNVVHALLLCLDTTLPTRSIFNITNQEPKTISEVYHLLADKLDRTFRYRVWPYRVLYLAAIAMENAAKTKLTGPPLLTQYGLGLISYDLTLNTGRANEVLGYQPVYTIAEGLERYAEHLDRVGERTDE